MIALPVGVRSHVRWRTRAGLMTAITLYAALLWPMIIWMVHHARFDKPTVYIGGGALVCIAGLSLSGYLLAESFMQLRAHMRDLTTRFTPLMLIERYRSLSREMRVILMAFAPLSLLGCVDCLCCCYWL